MATVAGPTRASLPPAPSMLLVRRPLLLPVCDTLACPAHLCRCDVDIRKDLYSNIVLSGGWAARPLGGSASG